MSLEKRSIQYGAVFGDWHIQRMLGSGSGGKSAVFEIYRDNKGWIEYNALKAVSLIEEQGDPEVFSPYRMREYSTAAQNHRKKAEQEVRLMEQLRGKTNIVDYLDHQFFEWRDETGFGVDLLIRMEKLSDLRNELKNGRSFSEEEIVQIGKDMCQALIICHKKNILHRDIKPENIFINSDGDYKLGDFGISRIMSESPSAMASTGIGTAAYSAPEQFAGAYDKRVDIYSLGLVLYEMANGNKLPFAQSSYVSQGEIQLRLSGTALPAPRGVSEALAKVILKACAFKAEDRYSSAEELLRALENPGEKEAYSTVAIFPTSKPADPYETAPAREDEYAKDIGTSARVYETMPTVALTDTDLANRQNYSAEKRGDHGNPAKRENKKSLLKVVVSLCALGVLFAILSLLLFKCEFQKNETPPAETTMQLDNTEQTEVIETPTVTEEPTQPTEIQKPSVVVRTGRDHTVVLYEDGTVTAYGNNEYGQCDVRTWRNIVDISCGDYHTVGVRSDGTVLSAGRRGEGQCDTNSWYNVVAVSAGDYHTVGLRSDGSLIATGWNTYGQCNVESLHEYDLSSRIIAVEAGYEHTVVLWDNGTVMAVGRDHLNQCNVYSWRNIVAIQAGTSHTVGLTADGTVLATGDRAKGQCDVSGFYDIVSISCGDYLTAGIRKDGTIIIAGAAEDGQNAARWWSNMAQISCGNGHIVGVMYDGTIIGVGRNDKGQCDIVN